MAVAPLRRSYHTKFSFGDRIHIIPKFYAVTASHGVRQAHRWASARLGLTHATAIQLCFSGARPGNGRSLLPLLQILKGNNFCSVADISNFYKNVCHREIQSLMAADLSTFLGRLRAISESVLRLFGACFDANLKIVYNLPRIST